MHRDCGMLTDVLQTWSLGVASPSELTAGDFDRIGSCSMTDVPH